MKFAISYFYQIRNFKKNMIPISTALFDPLWYHDFKEKNHIFIDKRGIVNGLRALDFYPGKSCEGLCHGKEECGGAPESCAFLREYRKQLDKIDLKIFIKECNNLLSRLKNKIELEGEPIFVFIVYEAPSNPCSERRVLIDYFKDNNIECEELEYPI